MTEIEKLLRKNHRAVETHKGDDYNLVIRAKDVSKAMVLATEQDKRIIKLEEALKSVQKLNGSGPSFIRQNTVIATALEN